MKHSRLVLVLILLAVAALLAFLWVGEGPLWRWVKLKKIHFETTDLQGTPILRGWYTAKRWDSNTLYGRRVEYWASTGFLKSDISLKDTEFLRSTYWNKDGTVEGQVDADGEERLKPPWLWGMTDQMEPTAPWWGKE